MYGDACAFGSLCISVRPSELVSLGIIGYVFEYVCERVCEFGCEFGCEYVSTHFL